MNTELQTVVDEDPTQINSPEQTSNPERDGVVSLLHNFYEERQKNTPDHRRYAVLWNKKQNKEEINDKEKQEMATLSEAIIESKITIARELFNASDKYRDYVNMGKLKFEHQYPTYASDSYNSPAIIVDLPLETKPKLFYHIVFITEEDKHMLSLIDELKNKYQIADDELTDLKKLDWSEAEKTNLQTLQQNAANYKEYWKDEKVELDGHQFSSSREAGMKQLLLGAFIEAEYDRLGLPIVHKGRVTTDILIGQFVI